MHLRELLNLEFHIKSSSRYLSECEEYPVAKKKQKNKGNQSSFSDIFQYFWENQYTVIYNIFSKEALCNCFNNS